MLSGGLLLRSHITTVAPPLGRLLADSFKPNKEAVDAGKSYDQAIKDIKLPKWEKLPGFAQNLPGNIERYYDYWNRGI